MNRWPLLAVGCVLVGASWAGAQQITDRFERTLQQIQRDTQARVDEDLPLSQRALVDYGGYLSFNYLSFDDSNHNNHGLREYEFVGYGQVNIDNVHQFYFRGRADYRNYNSGDAVDDASNRLRGVVEEGWYQFDLQRYLKVYRGRQISGDLQVKAGRQFVAWGNGLTLDQYADGITGEFSQGPFAIDALAAVTAQQTVDFDTSRPHFFDDTHRGFFGASVSLTIGRIRPYAYFLLQRDYNPSEPLDANVIPTRYHYNSDYSGIGFNGAAGDHFLYGGEFTFEGGNTLSNSFDPSNSNQAVPQTTDRIEAYAADLRVEYLPGGPRRARFLAEGVLASGDTDRLNTSSTFGGNKPGTVDHAFNSLGVQYLGLAFQPPISNLLALRLGASAYPLPSARPFRELQTGIDLFVFGKLTTNAPIDETTGNRRYLGIEPDLSVNWQVTDDVILTARYGLFFPGEAIPSGKPGDIRQFLYTSLTYAF